MIDSEPSIKHPRKSELTKYGVKIEPLKDVRIVRETLKRIVFEDNNMLSCCEIVNINKESWIVPSEFIEFIVMRPTNEFHYSASMIDRLYCIVHTLKSWDLVKNLHPENVDELSKLSQNGAVVLKHNSLQAQEIKQFNYSEILNSLKNYLNVGVNTYE